jgi:hypothetical protein
MIMTTKFRIEEVNGNPFFMEENGFVSRRKTQNGHLPDVLDKIENGTILKGGCRMRPGTAVIKDYKLVSCTQIKDDFYDVRLEFV